MTVTRQKILYELNKLSDNTDLARMLDAVEWKPFMRCRIVLEIDTDDSGEVSPHGFEFRVRKPSEGKKP